MRRLRPRAAPRRPSVLRLGMLFCVGFGVMSLSTSTLLLRDEDDRETCDFHGYTSSRALRWIAGRRRLRRRKSCAVDDALRKKGRAANCRGVVEADGFAWGKTPIDVGGKHPSLSRSPPPAPAIDSQRRLTPPAEKRAKGGAWVAARLRIPTAEVFMRTRRSATAVVIATPLCLGPPTARAANLQMVSTVRPAIRSRPLPLRRRQPVTSAAVPAGGGCGRRACWSEAPTGFTYNNGDGSTTGTVALTLKRRAHRRS